VERGRLTVRLFASDLDGTLIDGAGGARRFAAAWRAIPSGRRPRLAYATGRLLGDAAAAVRDAGLPPADFVIGGVGTEARDRNGPLPGFIERFAEGWDRAQVEAIVSVIPGIARQAARYQHAHKSSWHLHDAAPATIAGLERRLAGAGLQAEIVYSSNRDLDILPKAGTKGAALAWLAGRLDIGPGAIVVAGDTGNDLSMFRLPGVRGILPANALPELVAATEGLAVYRSRRPAADGIVDGLAHYGVVPGGSPTTAAVPS
jgi:sucrose-6F-phosphate phosphohydrolase